jgi:hypothetical protein
VVVSLLFRKMEQFVQSYLKTLQATATLSTSIVTNETYDYSIFKGKNALKRDGLLFISNNSILTFAILFSEYTTHDCTFLYIDKLDSTGYESVSFLATVVVRAVVDYYASVCSKLHVQIYGATADQYLFHKSNSSKNKRIRTDSELIKWWLRTVHEMSSDFEKNWIVPGETNASAARLLPAANGWKWGLGIKDTEPASKLAIFPDDLVKKGVEYSDPKATVGEVIEVMSCLEASSQLRVIISLSKDQDMTRKGLTSPNTISKKDWDLFYNTFASCSFDSLSNAKDSSKKIQSTFEKLGFSATLITLSNENNQETVQPKDVPVNIIQGLVKRKPEIRDLTNLVKKKRV